MTGLFSTKHRLPCPEKKELFAIDLSVDFLPGVKAPVAERAEEDRLLSHRLGCGKSFPWVVSLFSLSGERPVPAQKIKLAVYTTIWKSRVQNMQYERISSLPDSGQSCLNFEGGKDANPDGIHACLAASKTQKGVRIGKIADSQRFPFPSAVAVGVPPFSKLCRPSILSRTHPAQLCIYLPFYSMLYSFFPPSPVIRYILSPLLRPPFCAAADRLFPPLPEILMKASKGRRGKGRK